MSYNKTKCDPELGRLIQLHLMVQGVQTPMEFLNADEELDRKSKIETIERHFKAIMETLGLDLTDDSLIVETLHGC